MELKQLWSKFIGNKRSEERSGQELIDALGKPPRHVAIIMDGNGRWAKKRGLPRGIGHRAGVDALRVVVRTCGEIGMQVLTLYAFSTENWKRPRSEVDILMNLLLEFLQKDANELHRNNIQIRVSGNLKELPSQVQAEIRRNVQLTRNNSGLIVNVALNYGGRVEIITATRKIAELVNNGKCQLDDIDEELFARFLYTAGLPDPDLLIRTSGEMRISNFLLWQLAYTEFYVTDVLWPDFSKTELLKALLVYQQRERRYGGLKA